MQSWEKLSNNKMYGLVWGQEYFMSGQEQLRYDGMAKNASWINKFTGYRKWTCLLNDK